MVETQSDISLLIISAYNLIALAIVIKWYIPQLKETAK